MAAESGRAGSVGEQFAFELGARYSIPFCYAENNAVRRGKMLDVRFKDGRAVFEILKVDTNWREYIVVVRYEE
jgi:hypothetical protein